MAEDKPKFTTAISQEAIDAAVAAVEKARAKPADEAGDVAALRQEVEMLKEQLAFSQAKGRETLEKLREEHDRVLRAAADLDNQKKRAQREKDEALKFGLERFLKELLPVADNLDRALAHPEVEVHHMVTGVKMISKLLEDILAKHGIKSFSAKDQVFDPRLHEAMSTVETDGPANLVHEEFLRGYTLNERLIRPALVAVTRPREAQAAPPEGATPVAEAPASTEHSETSGKVSSSDPTSEQPS